MPKRQSARRINSDVIQGEDSYIEIRFPKVGTMKAYRKSIAELSKEMEKLQENTVKDTSAILDLADKVELAGNELINAHLKAWNWVDDDETPLPQPDKNGVLDMLEIHERNWILQQFQVAATEKKG